MTTDAIVEDDDYTYYVDANGAMEENPVDSGRK